MLNTIKKSMATLSLFALIFAGFGSNIAKAETTWDTSGNYVIAMNYLGTDYSHDMSLSQDGSGNITGSGGSPSGSNIYTWEITSGTITNNTISITANYTATEDAVSPQTVLTMQGTIAEDGTISGTWSDNYQDGDRSGTWQTTSGTAIEVTGNVTTKPATAISQTDATLNGMNGGNAAIGHSFWASLDTFSTASPVIPAGVFSTPDMGAIAANTSFSAALSSTGITVIPNTKYFFAAWSNIDGTWYPGEILSFTTGSTEGEIGGEVVEAEGTLQVTSIETIDGTATADGTFESGWKFLFNITVPTDEDGLAMKFGNWTQTGGDGTIAAANNIRISSAQADNSGSKIVVTAADTYTIPDLNMITDMDPDTAGIQTQVLVEVAVPAGTDNGAYTTTYGVRSQ